MNPLRYAVSVLTSWPSTVVWRESALISVLVVAVIAIVAGFCGLLIWQPNAAALLRLPVILFVPAFAEELVFRGPLPAKGQTQHPVLWIAASVALFTFWHVAEAKTFLPGARLFLTAPFLACAAVLGLGCALMRYRTGSLWPPVILHALVVWLWQSAFGGPSVAELVRG